jgi:hypothetical protein
MIASAADFPRFGFASAGRASQNVVVETYPLEFDPAKVR